MVSLLVAMSLFESPILSYSLRLPAVSLLVAMSLFESPILSFSLRTGGEPAGGYVPV